MNLPDNAGHPDAVQSIAKSDFSYYILHCPKYSTMLISRDGIVSKKSGIYCQKYVGFKIELAMNMIKRFKWWEIEGVLSNGETVCLSSSETR